MNQPTAQTAGASSGVSHRLHDPNHYTKCKTCGIKNRILKERVLGEAHALGCADATIAEIPGDNLPFTAEDQFRILRRHRKEQEKKKQEKQKKHASVEEIVKPALGAHRSTRITKRPGVPKKVVTIKLPYKSTSVKPHTPLSPRSRKRSYKEFSEPDPKDPEEEEKITPYFLPFGIEVPDHRLPPMLRIALSGPNYCAPAADAPQPIDSQSRLIPLSA